MRLRVSINGRSYEVEVEVLEHVMRSPQLAGVRVERLAVDGHAVVDSPVATPSAGARATAAAGAPPAKPERPLIPATKKHAPAAADPKITAAPRARSRKSTVAGTWRGVGIGATGELCAPVPGVVTAIHAKVGETLKAGQRLFTIEIASSYSTASPPLRGTVRAPTVGKLRKLCVQKGDAVAAGQVVATIE